MRTDILGARWWQVFILSVMGGSFITFGALLSVMLSTGAVASGLEKLLLGLGFIGGFSLVLLSGSVLFTEVNVILPAFLAQSLFRACLQCMAFWGLSWVGNLCGALFASTLLNLSNVLSAAEGAHLASIMQKKLASMQLGALGWFQVVLSAAIGNWLVGMAAVLATRSQGTANIIMAVFFPVLMFVSFGVQHSPANMGFYCLGLTYQGIQQVEIGIGWGDAFAWNLIPASFGNIIGGLFLVCMMFNFSFPSCTASRPSTQLQFDHSTIELPNLNK